MVRGLKDQGLGNKVIADMFGMALRTYHDRVQRLSESSTFRGKSLWGAVLEFVQERGTVGRHEVLRRFSQDDGASVRGILADLVDLGLVYRSGRGDQTEYRARRSDEISTEAGNLERISNLGVGCNPPLRTRFRFGDCRGDPSGRTTARPGHRQARR